MQLPAGLEALDFALAGAREGFGPFLGVHQGFNPASTGLAMSLAGIAGVVATAPLGVLIDRIAVKRAAVILAVLTIAAGAGLITRSLWVVALEQVLIGVADTSLAPSYPRSRSASSGAIVMRPRLPATGSHSPRPRIASIGIGWGN